MIKSRKIKQTGFTIVELLIVIVVIAILAAISIVAYNGIRNRADDSAVQNDLANFAKKAEVFKVDFARYPGSNAELLSEIQMRPSKGSYRTSTTGQNNLFYCTDNNDATGAAIHPGDATMYVIAAKSNSGTNYYMSSAGKGTLGTGGLSAANYCNPIGPPANTWATNGYTQSTNTWNENWVLP